MSVDGQRYLHRSVARNYTDIAALAAFAARGEPECVDETTQRELTRRARDAWQQTMQRRWGEAAATINRVLDDFAAPADVIANSQLMSGVRAVRRSTQALGRRLDAQTRARTSLPAHLSGGVNGDHS